MKFYSKQIDDTIYVSVVGGIDQDNADEFKINLQKLLSENFREAIFSFTNVPFFSSAAVGKFFMFYKEIHERGRIMRIHGLNANMYRLFEAMNANLLFPVEM